MALEQEQKVFESRKQELLKVHAGKFVLIKGENIVGFFDDAERAVEEGAGRFPGESFLVKQLSEVEDIAELPALVLGLLRWQY